MGPIKEQLTVDEVAGMLKADRRVVYDLIKAGKIKAGKVGRGWRIEAESVANFLNNVQDAQKEEKVMGAKEFFASLKREEESESVTKQMELERLTELRKQLYPKVLEILQEYGEEARKNGIETRNKSSDGSVEYYYWYRGTQREFGVRTKDGEFEIIYGTKKDKDKTTETTSGLIDKFQQLAFLSKLRRSITFDEWDADKFRDTLNRAFLAILGQKF